MNKAFNPSVWFVCFCGLLVIVWVALQIVGNMRLTDLATQDAQQMFSWQWPNRSCHAQAQIGQVTVEDKNNITATVKIVGNESLVFSQGGNPQTFPFTAKLKYYRVNNDWILGSVEQE